MNEVNVSFYESFTKWVDDNKKSGYANDLIVEFAIFQHIELDELKSKQKLLQKERDEGWNRVVRLKGSLSRLFFAIRYFQNEKLNIFDENMMKKALMAIENEPDLE